MKRYLWAGVGVLVVGVFGYSWYRAMESPYRQVVRLTDGSSVRPMQMTVGKTHALRPPRFPGLVRWLGGAPPHQGAVLPDIFNEPRVVLWLEHRPAQPAGRGAIIGGRQVVFWHFPQGLEVAVVDPQGAYIPAKTRLITLLGHGEGSIVAVVLPRLPRTIHTVELHFLRPKADRPLRIPLPAVDTADPPALTPQLLPARVETPEFRFVLERLTTGRKKVVPAGIPPSLITHWRSLTPHKRLIPKSSAGILWRTADEWLEDPYGNRYRLDAPPPWHYPYWVYCCQVVGNGVHSVRIPIAPLSETEVRSLWEQQLKPSMGMRLTP